MATPHAHVKPHSPDECRTCAASGHRECQRTGCSGIALFQWNRELSPEETAAYEAPAQGPYGEIIRPPGPHTMAVFACGDHVLPPDQAARLHAAACPAPDPDCSCA
jgi:hypothetical protein